VAKEKRMGKEDIILNNRGKREENEKGGKQIRKLKEKLDLRKKKSPPCKRRKDVFKKARKGGKS